MKGDATFMDVLLATGILIESVANNSGYSAEAVATAILRQVAKKSADNPKG